MTRKPELDADAERLAAAVHVGEHGLVGVLGADEHGRGEASMDGALPAVDAVANDHRVAATGGDPAERGMLHQL